MQRRKLLKTVGGIGAVATASGAGILATTGSAAASTVNISAGNPGTVKNDRGDLSQVTIDPEFTVTWEDLDDYVGKIFYLVEAKVGGGDWEPIYRATPWIGFEVKNNSYFRVEPGTTGEYRLKQPFSVATSQDPRFNDGDGPDISASPLVIADEQGKPDYSSLSFPGDVDIDSFLDGTSIGGASDYPGAHEDGGFQNNYHDIDAGYYGAASDTAPLDNGDDNAGEGSVKTTPVELRYTFELQRPNLSQLKYAITTMYGGQRVLADDQATTWASLSDSEKKEAGASRIDGLEVSDINAGNSEIVMYGEDGYTDFGDATPSGLSYSQMQNNDGHVGVMVATTSFDVSVTNEGSGSGVTGSSNTGAN